MRPAVPLALVLALLAACRPTGGPPAPPERIVLADVAYDPHPEVPAILRDVALIDDDGAFTHPVVPGHRTTMDGRVALRVQGGTVDLEGDPAEVDRLARHLSFFLFAPERLDAPIVTGPDGARILADADGASGGFDVPFPPAADPAMYRLGHHTICDPTLPFAAPGERPNPYPCGPGEADDCYDLTVISSTSPGIGAQLWGTPATVQVAAPKTAGAHIVDVTLGEPVAGAVIPASPEWTEPAVTMDGRLMTGRLGRLPRAWTHPETGETRIRPYDLAYAVLPADAEPCDVTGWTTFHPISHAPYDPDLIGKYGIAAYPLRDTEGRLVPDGEDVGGTYPWVDREGANLFMTGVHGRISEQSTERYPRRCVTPGCDALVESVDFDRGYVVAGAWTHGKMVHLDGLLNNVDWAVGVEPVAHWWVDLYRDPAGEPVPIRLGGGRFIEALRASGGYPAGYTDNANIFDSLQNLAHHHAAARPVTPRDIVWVASSGVATDEIVFDDLLDPNAIVVSNMTASITPMFDDAGVSLAVPYHHNGQVRTLTGLGGVLAVAELDPDADEDIHLQNGATSLRWAVPAYGRIEAGTARVEPAALGGVEGRGLWLSGDAAVHYPLADQPELDAVEAYVGVYVDRRAPAAEARELLRFGDGTGVVLSGARVTYVDGDRVLHEVALPPADGWVHLAWRLGAGRREVVLVHDGFALDRYDAPAPVFSLGGGELIVGRATAPWTGLRGWIDDLVVLAHGVDPEVACNHARGTLVELDGAAALDAVAARYPAWAHEEVAVAARSSATSFVCHQDHRADYAAHLQNLPTGTVSVRDAVLNPQGPLVAGAPRPDASTNPFCLTCHHEDGRGGLTLDALAYDPSVAAEFDLRRQPTQPPRRVFGNVPAGWIAPGPGPGGPPEAVRAPPEGLLVDRWLLPNAD